MIETKNKLKFLKEEKQYFLNFGTFKDFYNNMYIDVKKCLKCKVCYWNHCLKRCKCEQ